MTDNDDTGEEKESKEWEEMDKQMGIEDNGGTYMLSE